MATFTKFDNFTLDLGTGKHDFSSDTLKVVLTNSAPTTATDTVLTDITQIAAGNGYTTGGLTLTTTSFTESSGTATLAIEDEVITASGGSIAEFRYAVVYNDTSATDPLIGWVDYGSGLTLGDGESLTLDFAASTITI